MTEVGVASYGEQRWMRRVGRSLITTLLAAACPTTRMC